MARRLLYGHGDGKSRTGYQILATSNLSGQESLSDEVVRQITRLRIRADDILEQQPGLLWIQIPGGSRLFGRVSVNRKSTGARSLEFRLLCLSAIECQRIHWDPFPLTELLEEQTGWAPRADGELDLLEIPKASPSPAPRERADVPSSWRPSWSLLGPMSAPILRRIVASLTTDERKGFTFAAPVGELQSDLTVQFDQFPKARTKPADSAPPPSRMRRSAAWTYPALVLTSLLTLALLFVSGWLWNALHRKDQQLGSTLGELAALEDRLGNSQRDLALADSRVEQAQRDTSRSARRELHQLFIQLLPEPPEVPGFSTEDDWAHIANYLAREDPQDEAGALKHAFAEWIAFEKSYRAKRREFEEFEEGVEKTVERLNVIDKQLDSIKGDLLLVKDQRLVEMEERILTEVEAVKNVIPELRRFLQKADSPPGDAPLLEP